MLLVSCSKSLNIQLDPEVNVLLSNDSKRSIHLTPKDKEYISLNEWLRVNSSSWHPTSGQYLGGVYLTSDNYGIQITKDHVVIYIIDSPKPKAMYIQKIVKGELLDVINIGK